jgi:hypothetical protein
MCHNISNRTNVSTPDRRRRIAWTSGAVRIYDVLRAACVTEQYIGICMMEALGFDIAQQCLQSILKNIFDDESSSGYFFERERFAPISGVNLLSSG